jgi:uncharacterized protein YwgA
MSITIKGGFGEVVMVFPTLAIFPTDIDALIREIEEENARKKNHDELVEKLRKTENKYHENENEYFR